MVLLPNLIAKASADSSSRFAAWVSARAMSSASAISSLDKDTA
eukprot:CAMPEP_0176149336 /NCGR_PEP_ID=MMETSP0120_2-20121206/76193_1 /TAXON_ID=160619 /ORGANISM="Kryptoperidinium foliaceum, Strain CCMP 1326" /LENGTH=42 /DNA_ID= /DNA_START= /DNA_END= /DNA_ORIENTATION=